jgi:hypothetical protein
MRAKRAPEPEPEPTHAVVGEMPCGRARFMEVDFGRAPKAADVKRVPLEAAREMGLCFEAVHPHG